MFDFYSFSNQGKVGGDVFHRCVNPPVNFALKKPTEQSSTDVGWTANLAVDGNTNGIFAGKSCTQTDWTSPDKMANPFWTVSNTEYLSDFTISKKICVVFFKG